MPAEARLQGTRSEDLKDSKLKECHVAVWLA